MYEHRKQPLASKTVYYQRVFRNLLFTLVILSGALLIGIAGYHFIAHASWTDSVNNASMILSGMGPVIEIDNTAGKLFSSAFALFSSVVFITNVGIIRAPVVHRIAHRLHIEE